MGERIEKNPYLSIIEENYKIFNRKSDSLKKEVKWIDIFYGKIKMDFKKVSPSYKFKYATHSGIEYYIRVIEVVKGKERNGETWLSRVTKETIGNAKAGYSNAIIKLDQSTSELLTKSAYVIEDQVQDLGSWMWGTLYYDYKKRPCNDNQYHTKYRYEYKNGMVRDIEDSAFPDLFMPDPDKPSKYKKKFDPDYIFPGERYVILIPAVTLLNPTVQLPDTFWNSTWGGVIFNGSFTYKLGGGDGRLGIICQLSSLFGEDNCNFGVAAFSGAGGHVGVGMGGHVEANLIFFFNALEAEKIAGVDWTLDWDLVFANFSGKSLFNSSDYIYSILTKIFKKSGLMGQIGKIFGIGKGNKKYLIYFQKLKDFAKDLDNFRRNKKNKIEKLLLKKNIEIVLKNVLSNTQTQLQGNKVISVQIPLSIAGFSLAYGSHIFVGLRGIKTDIIAQWKFGSKKISNREELYTNDEIKIAFHEDLPFTIINEIKYEDIV
jgi:hypothetical protein